MKADTSTRNLIGNIELLPVAAQGLDCRDNGYRRNWLLFPPAAR